MKTANEIFDEMKAVFEEESGYAVSDSCDMAVRMFAAACQTEALYIYADWVLRQCFPHTAEGAQLDSHAASRGLVRSEGEKATGEICFFVSDAAVSSILIPVGTVCMTAEGVSFETTKGAVIAQGETMCTVKARALEMGTKGNVQKGTVTFMTNAPGGVEGCTNPYAFAGGRDKESDEELRGRILEAFRGLSNGANAAWYKQKALEVEGVKTVTVIPCARGVGTVDVVIASEDGMPDNALIAAVKEKLEAEREICVDVAVNTPVMVRLDVTAEVKVKTGYDAATVLENVAANLKALFGTGIFGRKVYCTELCDRIYHTEGVESYRLISPESDYEVFENVLLTAGTMNVSRWE